MIQISTLLKGLIRWLTLCGIRSNDSRRKHKQKYTHLYRTRQSSQRNQVKSNRYHYIQCEYQLAMIQISTLLKGLIRWLTLCGIRSNDSRRKHKQKYTHLYRTRQSSQRNQVKSNRYHYIQCEYSLP